MPAELADEWASADASMLSERRGRLGLDRLRWALIGDAPTPKETIGFFAGMGVPISEVWGMSELTCIASVSRPQDAAIGTVGKLLPGLESRIALDGEFLVRGPLVMKGYRNEPARTAQVIDDDGWLHTGDILRRDADGYLRMLDRKSHLITNAAEKVMSSAHIENTIKAACPLIGAIMVIGDGRAYNTALVVLDCDPAAWPPGDGQASPTPASRAADPTVIDQIAAGIAAGNSKLSPAERIERFRVLPQSWDPASDELTPTLKVRRGHIAAKYIDEIRELYAPDLAPSVHEPIAEVDLSSAASAESPTAP